MPTYEYACKACGEQLEVVQSFTDEPLTKCPACKKKQLRKVFGSIGITFKGSGFYKTDSRSGSSTPTPKPSSGDSTPDSSSGSTSDAAGGSKSESKSESTAASKSDGNKASKSGTTAA